MFLFSNRNLIDEIAETHRLTRTNNDSYIMRTHIRNIESYCVPRILDKTVEGAITHVSDLYIVCRTYETKCFLVIRLKIAAAFGFNQAQ